MSRRWALALVPVLAIAAGEPVHAQPASDDTAQTPKKKKSSDKRKRKKPRSKPKQSEPAASDSSTDTTSDGSAEKATEKTTDKAAEPAQTEPADGEGPVVTDDDDEPDGSAASNDAARTDAPATRRKTTKLTAAGTTSLAATATPVTPARRSWFVAGRVGPSILDRSGTYDFKSNRQVYSLQRNVRWEVAVGRYVSRRLALALAVGSGPYVKHDAEDPLLGEITRFDVFPWHVSFGLEVHASVLAAGLSVGGVRETMRGTFSTYDADTFRYMFHQVGFERFGVLGSVHTGLELHWGHWGVELLAEATAVKLARGTYELDGTSNPAPSNDEMGYVGSLLLGLRWQ
jgi:hypothetical protein